VCKANATPLHSSLRPCASLNTDNNPLAAAPPLLTASARTFTYFTLFLRFLFVYFVLFLFFLLLAFAIK